MGTVLQQKKKLHCLAENAIDDEERGWVAFVYYACGRRYASKPEEKITKEKGDLRGVFINSWFLVPLPTFQQRETTHLLYDMIWYDMVHDTTAPRSTSPVHIGRNTRYCIDNTRQNNGTTPR